MSFHDEFGVCENELFRFTSKQAAGVTYNPKEEREAPLLTFLSVYISSLLMLCVGHLRDFLGKRLRPQNYRHLMPSNVRLFLSLTALHVTGNFAGIRRAQLGL